ncbi:MAG: hypothetical protein P9L94_19605 [Candidatus Hinthialibacter antarcticus]|nr:hypothetical protein [Candidatus Hinthialibacter antarcticus]
MNFQGIFHLFMQRVSGDAILEQTESIWKNNHTSDFDGWMQSARFAQQAFQDAGLTAEVHELPADGQTQFGDAVMPKSWNGRKAKLEMIAPQQKVIAERKDHNLFLGMWSPPTAPNGMEAELVCLANDDSINLPNIDVEGKIVLTKGKIEAVRKAASNKGASAVISCWSNSPNHPDWTQWIPSNSNSPGGWGTHKNDEQLIVLSVSPAQGEELYQLASEGPVKLRLFVDAHMQPGVLPMVDAKIEGESDEQEAWLLAPLNGPGANYHAASAAALLEAARIIQDVIKDGSLPKPARTLRFLLAPRPYGALAYAHQFKENAQRALLTFCLDSAAGDPNCAWSRWTLRTSPAPLRHFSDALIRHIAKDYLSNWRPQRMLENKPMSLSADIHWNDPAINIATHWLHGGASDEVRSTSGDAMEAVSRRSCIDLAVMTATTGYIASVLGVPDIPILSQWNYRLAQENIWTEVDHWMDKADEAKSAADLHEIWRDARLRLAGRKNAEAAALQSLGQIDPHAHECPEWNVVRELNYTIGDLTDSAIAAVSAHLQTRAAALEVDFLPEEPIDHSHEDDRIPKRIGETIGAITLDALPYDQWTSPVRRSPRTNAPYTLAWWLANGERPIGEIERLVRLEIPQFRECIPAWFTFLEKHGYVQFIN